jgi:hypothetical protein
VEGVVAGSQAERNRIPIPSRIVRVGAEPLHRHMEQDGVVAFIQVGGSVGGWVGGWVGTGVGAGVAGEWEQEEWEQEWEQGWYGMVPGENS